MKPQNDYRDFIIITIIVICALLTVLLVASHAQAQTAPVYSSRYNPPRHIEIVRERPRHVRKVWRQHDHGHGHGHGHADRCKPPVAVVGDQYATEQGAKEEADKSFMQTARWQHGERYMDRANADDAVYECGRSSVGSVAGQIFIRCRLSARPCRPDGERAN